MRLLAGETVRVKRRTVTFDEHMEQVESWEAIEVANVLVAPGSTSDVQASDRPDGTIAAYTLGFPKTFSGSLRGAVVEIRGRDWRVIGDPQPNQMENCPTQWWLTAQVEAIDG